MRVNPAGTEYYAWLASACMPSEMVFRIMEIYPDPAVCHDAFMHQDEQLMDIIRDRFRELLAGNGTKQKMDRMRELTDKHGISVIRYDGPAYPDALRKISLPPAFLFFQGQIQCLENRAVAMVGSRAASYSGQKAARKTACGLSAHGVSIISGLACGIDAASHQGCMDGGSPTIAVTATGLDTVYPKDNIRLRDEILSGSGLILSEYAPGEKPAGWHFPYRNRIIAGLGQALVLMEAKIRSGSMTTVSHALDQGKDVFVYPGEPESPFFEGNHQLLREGGIYFTCAEDILEDLHWLDNQSAVRQNSDCSGKHKADTPEQAAVLQALTPGSLGFDQLVNQTGLKPSVLMSTLTVLQISGIVEALPGKQYRLKN